ncbi:hypothetical protein ABID26_006336 [Mesorhizobium shonense]|uniref:Uncharacterized protein n=1 Tax=Mesorhizobium shonense TaxID=1209948 RepID=A0ABV2I3L7_9HYPH
MANPGPTRKSVAFTSPTKTTKAKIAPAASTVLDTGHRHENESAKSARSEVLQYSRKIGLRVVAVVRGEDIAADARKLGAHRHIDANKENAADD